MKNKKVEKFKLKAFGKVVTIILWLCLLFLIVKGIVSISNPSDINEDDLSDGYDSLEDSVQTENKAVSFAENFIKEYMTFSGDSDEYIKRLDPFTDDDLSIENSKLFEATYVNCISSTKTSDNSFSVDCIVSGTAEYTDNKNDSKDVKTARETYYLRTTVNVINNNFVVTDYPIFISSPKSIESDEDETLKGEELEDETQEKQIQKVVKSFLNAYYEGENTEIEYFVENFEDTEKEKPFKFDQIKDFTVNGDKNNIFYVKTSYYVTDDSYKFLQSMEFELTLKDGKFVITKYNNSLEEVSK